MALCLQGDPPRGREVFKCSFTSRNSKGARHCGGWWQHISGKEQKNRILMSSCSCAAVSIVGPSGKAYYLFHKCRADIHWGTEHRMRDNFWRVVASPFTSRGPGPSSQQPATGLVLFSFLLGRTVNHNQASIYCVTIQQPTLRLGPQFSAVSLMGERGVEGRIEVADRYSKQWRCV